MARADGVTLMGLIVLGFVIVTGMLGFAGYLACLYLAEAEEQTHLEALEELWRNG